jgi:hypothetical protein
LCPGVDRIKAGHRVVDIGGDGALSGGLISHSCGVEQGVLAAAAVVDGVADKRAAVEAGDTGVGARPRLGPLRAAAAPGVVGADPRSGCCQRTVVIAVSPSTAKAFPYLVFARSRILRM